jgi:tetratricopeptide (TPR) repeat protein
LCAAVEIGGVIISGLYGMGGIGNTAVALKLAELLTLHYPDAQIYLNLRGSSSHPLTTVDALAHVIRSFQPEARLPEDEGILQAQYRSILQGKRVLLLMDNAHGADQVKDLLPPAGSILLVTSRRHFALPGLLYLKLEQMSPSEAVDLALKIAPRLGDSAYDLVELCEYLPLALRISASTFREIEDLSSEAFIQALRDLSQRLECTGVELALRMGFDLLPEKLQACWRALAVFPGSFDQTAAAAVWNLEPEPARQALSRLLGYGLLEPRGNTQRYELHDLARKLAGELPGSRERLVASLRHAEYYRRVLVSAETMVQKGGEDALAGLSLFDLERENILAGEAFVAQHTPDRGEIAHLCMRYPDAGKTVLDSRLSSAEKIRWFQDALSAARQIEHKGGEGAHLGNLGNIYFSLGKARRAIEYYEGALAIAQETGDRRGEGTRLGNLGIAYKSLGDTQRAIEFHEAALAIARETGDRSMEGARLGNLGNAYKGLGETRRAIEYYDGALAIAVGVGDRRNEGIWLGNLGNAWATLGETRRAIEYYEQALAIARETGDRGNEITWLDNLRLAYAALGEARRAIEYHERELALDREIGDRRGEGAYLSSLGNAHYALGEIRQAIEYYEQALIISQEIGDRYGEAADLGNLGLAFADLGDTHRAIDYYEQALAAAREIGDRRGEGADLGNLGNAYAALGRTRQAIEYHEQALAIARETSDRRNEGVWLGNLGNAYAALGETRRAIEFHEQALGIARETGDRRGIATHSWNIGLAYEKLGDFSAAVEAMQVCVDFEKANGHPNADADAARVRELRSRTRPIQRPPTE